jgi:TetR/AcrR family transcriptional regulator, transcriptional repressor of aconitase
MPKLSRAKLEARRQHILRAAAICFDREGFHRTTIADVRREAGVSTGAIYTYFPNKEAIIRAMLEDAQGARRTQLDEAERGAGGEAERAVLMQWAHRVFTEEGAHIARVDVNLWAEALRDRAVAQLAKRALENATQTVAGVVARELRRSPLGSPGIQPRDVSAVLVAILLGLEVQTAVGVPLDSNGIVRVLAELFSPQPAPVKKKAARVPRKSARRRSRRQTGSLGS